MAATSMVHVRVDEHIKTQATETLAAMGLSVSDAVRVFLTRVVAEQQLPFALKAPNAGTRAAMEEARTIDAASPHVALLRCQTIRLSTVGYVTRQFAPMPASLMPDTASALSRSCARYVGEQASRPERVR